MRLLHCRTLKLEDFFQNATPSYAILSHTWEKEELTCQEILNIHGSHEYAKKKAGYEKIRNCCKQALEDGFTYVWIDTCCIDKSSSSELSEAINSMYSWYQNATICYAYLADVPLPLDLGNSHEHMDDKDSSGLSDGSDEVQDHQAVEPCRFTKIPTRQMEIEEEDSGDMGDEPDEVHEQSATEPIRFTKMPIRQRSSFSATRGSFPPDLLNMLKSPLAKEQRYDLFASSRWFTRGWTLQELLAPTSVRFFAQDWKFIGTKDFLSDQISRITGIDAATLKGRPVSEESIAKRMSWASKRVTTRPEDLAYCLIGIFGVNLPLLYGEGDRAFLRLQEEIMKNSDDQSLFAWEVSSNTENVPRQLSIKLFTTDESNEVEDLLPQQKYNSEAQLSLRDLGGFLAKSPAAFESAGNIVPYRNWDISTPYAMTNQGLRIQLEVQQYQNADDYLGILQCHYEDNFLGPLGVYITPIASASGDQFARDLSHLKPVVVVPKHVSTAVLRTIYIRQEVLLPTARDYDRTNHLLIRTLPGGPGYTLVGVYPEQHWNKPQKILRPPDGRGVLIFETSPSEYKPNTFQPTSIQSTGLSSFAVVIQTNISPVALRDKQDNYSCKVVVNYKKSRYKYDLLSRSGARLTDDSILDRQIVGKELLELAGEMSGWNQHTSSQNLPSEDANYDQAIARISKEIFMGQEMFVVDIDIRSMRLKYEPFFATDFLTAKGNKAKDERDYGWNNDVGSDESSDEDLANFIADV